MNLEIAQNYLLAIKNGFEISVEKNFDEIKGKTAIFFDISDSMH